ncbi:hypothetical protein TNCV_1572261 [Trichonephila clavipes]|uniref:Uncharacterized protein n=1 Tax=Trichonephila clavipes TaxID=2585209 RepID=A0A8X6SPN6_TRICX|nr:hypothetical protein TNCV_1572261 [Trichonephila clavipes]
MASREDLSDMELTNSPAKSPTPPLQPSLCEQRNYVKMQAERMQKIKKHKLAIFEDLSSYPGHEEDFYQNALEELQDIENSLKIAAKDCDSFPSCTTPGCSHYDSPLVKTQLSTPKN